VAEGKLNVTKSEKHGDISVDVVVGSYSVGDYFGELGLVHNIPR